MKITPRTGYVLTLKPQCPKCVQNAPFQPRLKPSDTVRPTLAHNLHREVIRLIT